MNTDQKGESIYLSVPYPKKSNRNSKYKSETNVSLVQMHGDEWQLVAKKKMMAGFFFFTKYLHWRHVAYWRKTGSILL